MQNSGMPSAKWQAELRNWHAKKIDELLNKRANGKALNIYGLPKQSRMALQLFFPISCPALINKADLFPVEKWCMIQSLLGMTFLEF